MSVLKSRDNKEMLIDCRCGCDRGIRFRVDEDCCFMTYTNGSFYAEQGETVWRVFSKKLKKIWAILVNKDYYYAEFTLTKDEFDEFKQYINSISVGNKKEGQDEL